MTDKENVKSRKAIMWDYRIYWLPCGVRAREVEIIAETAKSYKVKYEKKNRILVEWFLKDDWYSHGRKFEIIKE